jgi:RNA polymerase sigma-70 factor (ECF subfamily)
VAAASAFRIGAIRVSPDEVGAIRVGAVGVGAWQVVDDDASCTTPEQAFEQHFSMVWRSMRRLGVPESALDDAVQDVFLVLHRRWGDFQHQSSLSTWIYGILLRVASDHTRRARRERARYSPEVPELESSAESPDRLYQQREAAVLLRLALEQLDDKERQMLVLIDLEERSVVEAAEALGINLNTAYSRLRRARQSFEKALRAAQSKREARDPLEDGSPLTESNGE